MAEFTLNEPMLEMYIFETNQQLEQLERVVIASEKSGKYSDTDVNEIFRFMHTIKGSSAMMLFNGISSLAHTIEDLFYYIREQKPTDVDYSTLTDLVLEVLDFIKIEVVKIKNGDDVDGDPKEIIDEIKAFLNDLKADLPKDAVVKEKPASTKKQQYYIATDKSAKPSSENMFKANILFQEGCEMENIRGYTIVHNMKDHALEVYHIPTDIIENEDSSLYIREHGFDLYLVTKKTYDEIYDMLMKTIFLRQLTLVQLETEDEFTQFRSKKPTGPDPIQIPKIEKSNTVAPEILPEASNEPSGSGQVILAEAYQAEPESTTETISISLQEDTEKDDIAQKADMTSSDAQSVASQKAPSTAKQGSSQAHPSANHAPGSDSNATTQSFISVNVEKLDRLMDLVGEMVIAEAMVTQNPAIKDLEIDNFQKSAGQLHKITSELQDMVMAIRMVPLSTTFMKMQRITRDMCKKLGKEVTLALIGEETEVDKNIIESISDPLMHVIRNALDHGIEDAEERLKKGKDRVGKVILEAKNSGSDVLVLIKDDGKGLRRDKILAKAREHGLIDKADSEISDQEVYSLILLPGFSTKEKVTEYSGRGVGMDVVVKNLESVGGSVIVDSEEDVGTTITLKIPLTLAIIDGMNLKVGKSRYTIPIVAIKESFRPMPESLLEDPNGNEMIMVRGQCYPVLRLHRQFNVETKITDFTEGILIMVEHDGKSCCLFADELLGQQQVVVKALPNYIKRKKRITGLGGCTLLGDGNISLIIDIGSLLSNTDGM